MKRLIKNLATPLLLVAISSCKPAGYEIIRDNKGNSSGNPENLSPETPDTPALNLAPTARVEVIKDTWSVTMIRVGMPVTIRPSLDTWDLDDVGKSSCTNPGIIDATFTIGTEGQKNVKRSGGCESLSIPWTFTKPGTLKIDLVVTSNEGETARASMTLVVTSNASEDRVGGGLTIHADPIVQVVGQPIKFTARCDAAGTNKITWDFGSGQTGEGVSPTKAFDRAGPVEVTATCVTSTGKTYTAMITIVIVDAGTSLPPRVPPMQIPPRGTIPGIPPTQQPPVQTPPNQSRCTPCI